jgi:hypothetical protein
MKMSQADFERQFAEAKQLGDEELRTQPLATGVRFDKRTRRVIVELNKGTTLSVPIVLLQGVHDATIKDLSHVTILGPGFHIEWPALDQQFSIEGLIAGRFGNKTWMTALGQCGAVMKSKHKKKTSRANGKQPRRSRKTISAATI